MFDFFDCCFFAPKLVPPTSCKISGSATPLETPSITPTQECSDAKTQNRSEIVVLASGHFVVAGFRLRHVQISDQRDQSATPHLDTFPTRMVGLPPAQAICGTTGLGSPIPARRHIWE